MYFAPAEHNPPHFHVYYQGFRATIDINEGTLLSGHLPIRQLRLIIAWNEIHRDDLLANWELCQNGEQPFNIEPLK
jgi:hypothetical protein